MKISYTTLYKRISWIHFYEHFYTSVNLRVDSTDLLDVTRPKRLALEVGGGRLQPCHVGDSICL